MPAFHVCPTTSCQDLLNVLLSYASNSLSNKMCVWLAAFKAVPICREQSGPRLHAHCHSPDVFDEIFRNQALPTTQQLHRCSGRTACGQQD